MDYQSNIIKLPGLSNVATKALSSVVSKAGRSDGDSISNVMSTIKKLLTNLGEMSFDINIGPDVEQSISEVNSFLSGLSEDLRSTLLSMTELEIQQLQEFNATEQRKSVIDGNLDKLEDVLESLQTQRKLGGNETVIVNETFKNMDIADNSESLPSHNQIGGYITLKNQAVSTLPVDKVVISIDNVTYDTMSYPSTTESPFGKIHEGRFYGFPGEARAEGGRWNIDIDDIGGVDSSNWDIIHDPVTYQNDTDLNDILPQDIGTEPSSLRGVNRGPKANDLTVARTAMIDGNPESVWEIELLTVINNTETDLTKTEVDDLENNNQNANTLSVSITIDLGRATSLSEFGIVPKITSKYSNLKIISIETSSGDMSSFFPIIGTELIDQQSLSSLDGGASSNSFSWTFPPRKVRFIRFTMQETALEITPYPTMVLNFSRGISYETVSGFVPNSQGDYNV